MRLPLASWFRRHGEESLAKDIFVTLHQRRMGDAWGRIAGAERWLMQADGRRCPLPIYDCTGAASRPHLDGSLDEPLWSQLPPLLLRTDVDPTTSAPAASQPESADTEVRMGYDEQLLLSGDPRDADRGVDSHGTRTNRGRGMKIYRRMIGSNFVSIEIATT